MICDPIYTDFESSMMSSRKNRGPEEQARRAKIRELLQASNISSMEDIQNLFKETIVEFVVQLCISIGSFLESILSDKVLVYKRSQKHE